MCTERESNPSEIEIAETRVRGRWRTGVLAIQRDRTRHNIIIIVSHCVPTARAVRRTSYGPNVGGVFLILIFYSSTRSPLRVRVIACIWIVTSSSVRKNDVVAITETAARRIGIIRPSAARVIAIGTCPIIATTMCDIIVTTA